jgi:hypothetical protein
VATCNDGGAGTCTSCAKGPVSPSEIARACAFEVSCLSDPPLLPGGSCVTQFELGLTVGGIFFGPSAEDLRRYVDCAIAGPDCATVVDCATRSHGASWCNGGGNSCDGNTVVRCQGGIGLELEECDTGAGDTCSVDGAGYADCNAGTCDPKVPARCDGNRAVRCDSDGIEYIEDCGDNLIIETCFDGRCVPPGSTSCDPPTCDGAAIALCGGQLRVDCSDFAGHCVASNGDATCVPDATDCDDNSPDRCNGTALELCVNGKYFSIDCASLGLRTCGPVGKRVACTN